MLFGDPTKPQELAGHEQKPDPVSAEARALVEIFQNVGENPDEAASLALSYVRQEGQTPEEFMDAARRLIFLKTQNSHDYKFSSAVMEDYYHISPAWRDRYLASSVYYLRGTGHPDNKLAERTRAALES